MARKPYLDYSDGKHTCAKCGERKPLEEFYPRKDRPSGRLSRCKVCHRAERAADMRKYTARRIAVDPDFHWRQNLRRYNLTPEQFYELLHAQGGVCGVCGGPPMGRGRYHVDHCHATGAIRGLLCHKCNVALGMVQDSTEHLERLIAYLKRTQ